MSRPFRFAVQARYLADPEDVTSAARQAEDLGYDEFYSYDHLGSVDPFSPLILAAAATSTLRVGPLVINNEFHHPVLLARTAATVDRLTGGRLVLGIGTGYAQAEHDAMNIELRPPAARVERLTESMEVLRSLLDSGSVRMTGRHHQLDVPDLGVRPVQARVPLLVGGNRRKVIEAAGRFADIFQFTGATFGPDGVDLSGFTLPELLRRAGWLSEAAGERDGSIERSVLVQQTSIGASVSEAEEAAVAEMGLSAEVVRSTPFLLFGSVGAVVDRLERLREATGVSHLVVRDPIGFAPVVDQLRGR